MRLFRSSVGVAGGPPYRACGVTLQVALGLARPRRPDNEDEALLDKAMRAPEGFVRNFRRHKADSVGVRVSRIGRDATPPSAGKID